MTIRRSRYLCLLFVLTLFLPAVHSIAASTRERARDFALNDIEGNIYQLSRLRGNVVLINFWATWCTYCLKENPSLEALYRKFRNDNFIVLGVSIDRSASTVTEYLREVPLSYPVLMDSKGDVFVKTYTVIGIPVSYIIDKEGYIIEKLVGRQHFNSRGFIKKIDRLLSYGENPE